MPAEFAFHRDAARESVKEPLTADEGLARGASQSNNIRVGQSDRQGIERWKIGDQGVSVHPLITFSPAHLVARRGLCVDPFNRSRRRLLLLSAVFPDRVVDQVDTAPAVDADRALHRISSLASLNT